MNREQFLKTFADAPVVGILRGYDLETCDHIAEAYEQAGLKYLEVTMNTKGAAKIIASLKKKYASLEIGAGTVCTLAELDEALMAGATFIVTPVMRPEVIKKAMENKVPIFPGAYTPTEIFEAWEMGVTAVKIFPATALGSSYVKNVLGPLDQIKLLPTGGISKDNIKEFLDAGAIGAGMGSTLFPKALIKEKNWDGLEKHFKSVLEEIKA